MKLKADTPLESTAKPLPDRRLAEWRHLTEALIFAAPYGTREYLRLCDETGLPYDRDAATRRCVDLGEAVCRDYSRKYALLSCHAANDDPAFRLRYSHLLPKRPGQESLAERRTGIKDEDRQAAADALWADQP